MRDMPLWLAMLTLPRRDPGRCRWLARRAPPRVTSVMAERVLGRVLAGRRFQELSRSDLKLLRCHRGLCLPADVATLFPSLKSVIALRCLPDGALPSSPEDLEVRCGEQRQPIDVSAGVAPLAGLASGIRDVYRILTAPHFRRLSGRELGVLNGSDLMLPRDIATACPKLRQLNFLDGCLAGRCRRAWSLWPCNATTAAAGECQRPHLAADTAQEVQPDAHFIRPGGAARLGHAAEPARLHRRHAVHQRAPLQQEAAPLLHHRCALRRPLPRHRQGGVSHLLYRLP